MSGLSRTPGKRVYGESRTAGSNPALSARHPASRCAVRLALCAGARGDEPRPPVVPLSSRPPVPRTAAGRAAVALEHCCVDGIHSSALERCMRLGGRRLIEECVAINTRWHGNYDISRTSPESRHSFLKPARAHRQASAALGVEPSPRNAEGASPPPQERRPGLVDVAWRRWGLSP